MADNKKKIDRDHASDMLLEWAPKINMHVKKLRSQGIPSHIEDSDLHTAGMDGLMDAFHRYETNKGNFGAFANKRIFGKMMDHVTSSGGANSVDKLFRDQAKAFNKKNAMKSPVKPTEEED